MGRPLTPVLFDQNDARARGRAHGELWRAQIRELAALRLELALAERPAGGRAALETLAMQHVPVLRDHFPDLADELEGIAEGAAVDVASVVVLNNYSDIRDVAHRGAAAEVDAGDGCTAIYFAGDAGPVLGQTWDMHGSALPFVRLLRIAPSDGSQDTVCLSLTGCLGLAGLGRTGVAVTINNLESTDAGLGVAWPAMVRAMLRASDAVAARDLLERTPLTSGHHYMIADGRSFFGVETSGVHKVRTQSGAKAAHLHTNHCFDPVLRMHERMVPGTTSFDRLNMATTLYVQQRPRSLDGLWALLSSHEGHPRGICCHTGELPGGASHSITCARIAIELWTGRVRVATGCSRDEAPIELAIEGYAGGRPDDA
jgi:isopenicillin-N N-acyltransferase-like protein